MRIATSFLGKSIAAAATATITLVPIGASFAHAASPAPHDVGVCAAAGGTSILGVICLSGTDTAPAPTPTPSTTPASPVVNADVPVQICGIGIGVLGDAAGSCPATGPSAGAGTDSGGGVIDATAPIQVCGIAAGVIGDASSSCPATGPTTGTTPGTTTGGGLVEAVVPVQVCGITAGVLGNASSTCAESESPAPPEQRIIPTATTTPTTISTVPAAVEFSEAPDSDSGLGFVATADVGSNPSAPQGSDGSSLPITGISVGVLLASGAALVGWGAIGRRMAARRTTV